MCVVPSQSSAQEGGHDQYAQQQEGICTPEQKMEEEKREASGELQIGDRGFRHCELHKLYQEVFAQLKCHCDSGQCRPTKFEDRPDGSRWAWVNRKWHKVAVEVMKYMESPPAKLQEYSGHICAVPDGKGGITTECAVKWMQTNGG